MKKEFVVDGSLLKSVNEIETLLSRCEMNETNENLKNDDPDKIIELEEALLNKMGENDLKIFKTEFLDKWKFSNERLTYLMNILIASMIIKNVLII